MTQAPAERDPQWWPAYVPPDPEIVILEETPQVIRPQGADQEQPGD